MTCNDGYEVRGFLVCYVFHLVVIFFFFQAEDGIRDLVRSRGLGDVYKRQVVSRGLALSQPDKIGSSNRHETQGITCAQQAHGLARRVEQLERGASDDVPATRCDARINTCLLYTSPSPRDRTRSRMPSSA
mgnify:CR=1 FL=1